MLLKPLGPGMPRPQPPAMGGGAKYGLGPNPGPGGGPCWLGGGPAGGFACLGRA